MTNFRKFYDKNITFCLLLANEEKLKKKVGFFYISIRFEFDRLVIKSSRSFQSEVI